MDIDTDNLTVKQVRDLQCLLGGRGKEECPCPFKVGENYLIRTVTMIQIGRLESVGPNELVLSSAAWIADTGRFYDALKTGKLKEIEPFPNEVIIGRGSIIDATLWKHDLPKEQK
jgi:hypothetical protein